MQLLLSHPWLPVGVPPLMRSWHAHLQKITPADAKSHRAGGGCTHGPQRPTVTHKPRPPLAPHLQHLSKEVQVPLPPSHPSKNSFLMHPPCAVFCAWCRMLGQAELNGWPGHRAPELCHEQPRTHPYPLSPGAAGFLGCPGDSAQLHNFMNSFATKHLRPTNRQRWRVTGNKASPAFRVAWTGMGVPGRLSLPRAFWMLPAQQVREK